MFEMKAVNRWLAPLHLDCVHFLDDEFVVCAGYEYEEATGKRLGAFYVLNNELQLISSVSLPGVFDFRPVTKANNPHNHLLAACADGSLYEFRMKDGCLQSTNVVQVDEADMLLACDRLDDLTVTCTNTGKLHLLKNDLHLGTVKVKNAPVEVWWTTFFDQGKSFFSTDDSGSVALWDTQTMQITWQDTKSHSSGVCCAIQNSNEDRFPDQCNLFFTGSYDNYVRGWDRRCRDNLWSLNLGAGVWRFTQNKDLLVCSAMRAGVHVVDLKVQKSMAHLPTGSWAYGTAIIQKQNLICGASVSFLDNTLITWHLLK